MVVDTRNGELEVACDDDAFCAEVDPSHVVNTGVERRRRSTARTNRE
jgi:hypothetical protein